MLFALLMVLADKLFLFSTFCFHSVYNLLDVYIVLCALCETGLNSHCIKECLSQITMFGAQLLYLQDIEVRQTKVG